jgi:hypothetical protein
VVIYNQVWNQNQSNIVVDNDVVMTGDFRYRLYLLSDLTINPALGSSFNDDEEETMDVEDQNEDCDTRVTVVKDVAGGTNGQDFAFTDNISDNQTFDCSDNFGPLDDDPGSGTPSSKTCELSTTGTFTITEGAVSGWTVTGVNCVSNDPGDTSSGDPATRTATVRITDGEHVTCTFVNSNNGILAICKSTTPAVNQKFTFQFSYSSDTALGNGQCTASVSLPAGVHTVSEVVPAGWALTGVDGAGCPALEGNSIEVTLGAGQTIVCTFHNESASLALQKCVVNDDGGTADAADWDLFADGEDNDYSSIGAEGDFDDVTHCAEYQFRVLPGTYIISENGGPDDYLAGQWFCQKLGRQVFPVEGVETPEGYQIAVGAGDTVHCAMINDDIAQGSITISKEATDGGNWRVGFRFNDNIPNCNIGTIEVRQSHSCGNLQPGTYVVSEVARDGWKLDHITCSGTAAVVENEGSASVRIVIEGGESARCSFYNDPPEEFGPTPEPPTPVPTAAPTQQVAGVQTTPTPVAVVESIRPPETGSGGLRGGGKGSLYALLAGLIGVGAVTAAALHRHSKQA